MGYQSLNANTNGAQNTAIGDSALLANVSGNDNTGMGFNALNANTTGNYNVADGSQALYGNTLGGYNTAMGHDAMKVNQIGSQNTAVGYQALNNTTGENNDVAIGYQALRNEAGTGPGGNIAIGAGAGINLIGGIGNIYIGNAGVDGDIGIIRIGDTNNQSLTYIAGTIENPVCNNLSITGGSDLAEPFPISTAEQAVAEGEVVVIDEENPGQLKLTDQPYDTHVAGVVSGANGIHPGIQMHQEGLLGGGKNVALSGRVYVQADASNGAIKPGDLLTTSINPGHAMKVTDHARAVGAILGKAMTGLKEGKGMVLVLVTLQ
jgi:hypothetical protein